MNPVMRKAAKEDASSVGHILHECFNIDSDEEGSEIFLSEFEKNNYIVCEVDGRMVGFISWKQHHEPKHELAELDRIGVLLDFRGKDDSGKSIGQMLFDSMIDDMKRHYLELGQNLRKVYLLVHASNDRARKFYERCGMHLECTIPNHLYDGMDECVYARYFNFHNQEDANEQDQT
jgi:ribosomal protein S18 acetylase RimI-like enzyme